MTYLEIRKSVAGLLRGDNSKAEELLTSDETYLSMAIRDISMRCIPQKLLCSYDETKTDVFRRLHSTIDEEYETFNEFYIKIPVVSIEDTEVVEIDAELMQAVIFFMCSYLSNKKNKDYVKSAQEIISFFDSYSVDFSQYEL